MKKRKIIYSIILVILIGFILTLYNALNGNPITNFIGKKVAQNYLEETYPGEEFRVETGSYDFKFGEYHYDVIRIGVDPYAVIDSNADVTEQEKQYEALDYYITVKGTFKPQIRHDSIRYARLDDKLSQKLSEEASLEIFSTLQRQLPNLKSVEANVEVIKFTMDENTVWSKDLNLDEPVTFHMVTDATNQTADEALTDGIKIQKLLKDMGYNYGNVNINGNAFDKELGAKDEYGYVKYAFSFTADTKLSLKDIDTFN